jgi:RNA polymerase sigma factor (sigma-70 family)
MDTNDEKELIERHQPLVREIIGRIGPSLSPEIDTTHLFDAGVVGLLAAARAFDVNGGAPFKTSATIRIRGAILDEMLRQYRNSKTVTDKISPPEDEGDEVKMGPRLFLHGVDAREAAADKLELEQILTEHRDRFTDTQRRILEMYYFSSFRVADIAATLGLTEPQVCRLHTETLLNLSALWKARHR